MKTLYIIIISAAGIGAGLAALMIFGNISLATVPFHDWNKMSENQCGEFYTIPENKSHFNTVPVLLLKSNSTACARLTFTITSNYKDCNGPNCQHVFQLAPILFIRNLHYEKNGGSFSITPGKDYTNSFDIINTHDSIDLENYPIGT